MSKLGNASELGMTRFGLRFSSLSVFFILNASSALAKRMEERRYCRRQSQLLIQFPQRLVNLEVLDPFKKESLEIQI